MHCATSRKVPVSIPDFTIGNFHWHNLRSTQPLRETSTRNISWWGKVGRCVDLTTLPPSCADCVEVREPQTPGTLRACTGTGGRKNECDIISRRSLILLGVACHCLAKTHAKYNFKNVKYSMIITLRFTLIMINYLSWRHVLVGCPQNLFGNISTDLLIIWEYIVQRQKIKFIDDLCITNAQLMLLTRHRSSYHTWERWTR
jgi:hypothetical protein